MPLISIFECLLVTERSDVCGPFAQSGRASLCSVVPRGVNLQRKFRELRSLRSASCNPLNSDFDRASRYGPDGFHLLPRRLRAEPLNLSFVADERTADYQCLDGH